MNYVFCHARPVAFTAFPTAMQTGMTDYRVVDTCICHIMYNAAVKYDIIEAVTRDGIATASAHRTTIQNAGSGRIVSESELRNPVVRLKNTRWALSPARGSYLATANVGSRDMPRRISISVSCRAGRMLEWHVVEDLWITPTTYTTTYLNIVLAVKRPTPSEKSHIIELLAGVGRVPGAHKNILAGLRESRRVADIILDPAPSVQGRWSNCADKLVAGPE